MSESLTLAELARQGMLRAADLDVVMVALGYLSYEAIAEYLACRDGPAAQGTEAPQECDVPALAREITTRICNCQYHDGGRTELVAAHSRRVHLRIAGACVYCPQIRYTMRLLEQALRFRAPQIEQVEFDGARYTEKAELPTNRQLTMALFMRQSGLTFADLDAALHTQARLTDDDLMRMALLRMAMNRLGGRSEP